METFVSLDVETANEDLASICQVGIARYQGGKLVDEYKTYIDPEDYFCPINTDIHGITKSDVTGAPTFPEVIDSIKQFINGDTCLHHTHFDKVAFAKSYERYELGECEVQWLDTARVARRTWEQCAYSGYGLQPVCEIIGYNFKHHDALEDAKASAEILLSAIKETGIQFADWSDRLNLPIHPEQSSTGTAIKRTGNVDGPFYGQTILFTGALEIPRREAADLAAKAGFQVAASPSKKISILVVGDQDLGKLAEGQTKSKKHLAIEKLISKGHSIRIIKESDFQRLT